MKSLGFLFMALTTSFVGAAESASPAPAARWTATTWKGEAAFTVKTARWSAVVSVERGRLVHFGPANGETNLLLTPDVRGNDTGWGGHRVWLGPQATWPVVWPPPKAWEQSAAESAKADGARLELVVPDAGDGWARLTRVYSVSGDRLECTVRVAAGGKRAAQVMQILQLPRSAETEVEARPTPNLPKGYVRLFGPKGPILESPEKDPSVVTRVGGEKSNRIRTRFTNEVEKLGFPPQTIEAHINGHTLRLGRGHEQGPIAGQPDGGLHTQVYCGTSYSQFVEIEQMSPTWSAGAAAEHTMWLEL